MSDTNLRRSARISSGAPSKGKSKMKDPPARKSPPKKKRKVQPTTSPPDTVYLRVNQRFLRLHNPATAAQPNPPTSLPPSQPPLRGWNLNVIAAPLADLQFFAGNTVDWLIRVARFILDPCGTGVLSTFQTETVDYWLGVEKDNSWRTVQAGEVLEATVYEYRRLNNQLMVPTRVSLRQTKSVTTNTSQNQAANFRTALLQRHSSACVVSGISRLRQLKASHLIPRRMGDNGVQSAFQLFTGLNTPVTRYHPSIGILLCSILDDLVDVDEIGFWGIGPNQYEVHAFCEFGENLNVSGANRGPNDLALHRLVITIGQTPPSGVFDWHYMQCVLQRFGTPGYKGLQNIAHFVFPIRTDDDDDDDPDFDDPRNIDNPPYPSYPLDLAWSRRCQQLEEEQRRQAIERWRPVVTHT